MSKYETGRRKSQVVTLRLDDELDADLIEWLTRIPHGKRSEVIRATLRNGLDANQLKASLEIFIQSCITDAIAKIPVSAIRQGVQNASNSVEDDFGDRLDSMLGQFG